MSDQDQTNPAAEPGSTTASFLDQLRLQRPAAWDRLMRDYGPLIERCARQQGLQGVDVADVRQLVLLTVLGKLHTFQWEPGKAALRSWISRIAINKAIDLKRRRLRSREIIGHEQIARELVDPNVSSLADRSTPERDPRLELLRESVMIVRSQVKANTWSAFELKEIHGLSPKEVAELLGMSTTGVLVACHRVNKRLRETFARLKHSRTPDLSLEQTLGEERSDLPTDEPRTQA